MHPLWVVSDFDSAQTTLIYGLVGAGPEVVERQT